MFLKLRNLLLASPALIGVVMLNSGSAIATESPWSQLNGDSGDIELTTPLDASNAGTFDLLPTEEGTFTSETDIDDNDLIARRQDCVTYPSGACCVPFPPFGMWCW